MQLWNAFHDSTGNIPQTSSGILPPNSASQDLLHRPPTSADPYVGFRASEVLLFSVGVHMTHGYSALLSYSIEIYAGHVQ